MAAVAHLPAVLVTAALEEAIGLVRRGWTQGAYCRTRAGHACLPDGSDGEIRRVDLAWAVERAAESQGLSPELLRGLVLAQLPEPYRSDTDYGLERWNDKLWRSRTEVVMVLTRTRDEL